MPAQHRQAEDTLLPPFPEGWYFVATHEAVMKAKLMRKTWMGESIVVWCDDDGQVCVAESTCPHLGSDLGPDVGGRVRNGRLVCPFHGFEYDATGQCVATPYAPAPRAARLRIFPVREILGLIFAWWGMDGREPQWLLPADSLETAGWSPMAIRTVRFPGHPQETTENSVDLAHFRYVHGYHNFKRTEPVVMDGSYLESRFEFERTGKIAKIGTLNLAVSACTRVFGLGYSFVEVHERTIGMDVRLWLLATPVDGRLIDMTVVTQVGELRNPKRWITGLKFLPVSMRAP